MLEHCAAVLKRASQPGETELRKAIINAREVQDDEGKLHTIFDGCARIMSDAGFDSHAAKLAEAVPMEADPSSPERD